MQDATADGPAAVHDGIRCARRCPHHGHCDHLIQAHPERAPDPQDPSTRTRRCTSSWAAPRPSTASASGSPAPASSTRSSSSSTLPGGMMIGTVSHTPNAGGLGMKRIGVGGADAVDDGRPAPSTPGCPGSSGCVSSVASSGWTPQKDVILCRWGPHRQGGDRGHRRVLRARHRVDSSATGKATIGNFNMGAEIGATCSLVPLRRPLGAVSRRPRADGSAASPTSTPSSGRIPDVEADAERFCDRVTRSISTTSSRTSSVRTPPISTGPSTSWYASRPRSGTHSTSRTRWSGRARTRPTRTSAEPRTSRAKPAPPG